MITSDTKLADLPRISATNEKRLQKLGLATVRDLLYHFPFRYDDFSHIYTISELTADTNATIIATVHDVKTTRIYKRHLVITTATFTDDTGSVHAVWFNQPFVEQTLKSHNQLRISGKIAHDERYGLHFSAPNVERVERTPTSTGRLVPIYPETAGITSKWLRWQIHMLLEKEIVPPDLLPQEILTTLHLPDLRTALHIIHFPRTQKEVLWAQKRFMFEEMFILQLITLRTRAKLAKEKAQKISFDQKLIKDFIASLPFTLTNAQRKSSFAILKNMERTVPMNRLLNGDVGAGKTLVGAIAVLQCIAHGHQAVLLAPTEVLAMQHFHTFLTFFEKYDHTIGLLTGAHKIYGTHPALTKDTTRAKMLSLIKDGEIQLIVGTHAIIQEDVAFKDLCLIIVDEQQRFGVAQRAKLTQKSMESNDGNKKTVPHFLTMTATPIPRTFALAIFGDLDISLLDEKPLQRKEIKTEIVAPSKQDAVYDFMKKEIKKGRQAYIILPLVEESDLLKNVKAAKEEYKRLSTTVFVHYSLGLMHGKLKPKEKESLMEDFKNGKIDILVSTSVVEVGVDVPNATVMIIENAERFGLSQLHQFRGRIGRGKHQSYCFLFSRHIQSKRLQAMQKYTDGFKLAEIDLQLRGPGEFLGTQQSGLPDGAMKNIANVKLVTLARTHAKKVLSADPTFRKHPSLEKELTRFYETVHME